MDHWLSVVEEGVVVKGSEHDRKGQFVGILTWIEMFCILTA